MTAADRSHDLPAARATDQDIASTEDHVALRDAIIQRWTNDSTARVCSGGTTGDLDGNGAPRWKRRALYDSLKDTLPRSPATSASAVQRPATP